MDYINDRDALVAMLRKELNDDKYYHSLSTEKRAVELAELHGADTAKAGFAGLMHDIVKCMDNVALAKEYGIEGYTSKKVLHAYNGAIYLERHGICGDRDILNAVKYHTTGRAAMTLLEKIIYLADLTEPLRDFDGVDKMRRLSNENLDEAMAQSSKDTIKLLAEKNLPIDENTVLAYNYYIKYLNKK